MSHFLQVASTVTSQYLQAREQAFNTLALGEHPRFKRQLYSLILKLVSVLSPTLVTCLSGAERLVPQPSKTIFFLSVCSTCWSPWDCPSCRHAGHDMCCPPAQPSFPVLPPAIHNLCLLVDFLAPYKLFLIFSFCPQDNISWDLDIGNPSLVLSCL